MASAVRPADGFGNGAATYGFTYSAAGLPLTATDPDGVATANSYDGAGNLTAAALDPAHLNLVTQFAYDDAGDVTAATDPRGNVTTSLYDLDRRKIEDDRHDGNAAAAVIAATQTVYDVLGRVVDEKAGTAFSGTAVTAWLTTAHTTYTPVSKPASVTDADSRTVTTTYDALDRVDVVADPIGRKVHNAYDAAGQLLVEYRAWGDALQIAYATHAYTPNGKEASVYDALGATHTTTYTYDGFDRLAVTTYPDASHESLSYDADGNVTSRTTRAGDLIAYGYDLLDRLRTKAVPSTSGSPAHAVASAYTLAGRVTALTDSTGPALGYGFDTAGRATSETQTTLGVARTVTSTLDANGNRTRLTWPDAFAVNYAYDALNRLSTATVNGGALLASYAYDPLSRRTGVSYNSGTSAMSYTYTDAGDLLTLTDDFAGTSNDVTFTDTYTNAHQLASETVSNAAYSYTTAATPTAYAAVNTLNQYTTVGGNALTWDANGNLATASTGSYTHDPENRMTRAIVPGTSDSNYTYDPLGRRVVKTISTSAAPLWGSATWNAFTWTAAATTAVTYLHDGSSEIAEYDGAGALIRRFVPGPSVDEFIAMVTAAGTKTFVHVNRQGSIIATADTSGAPAEGPYTYDAYGNCFTSAGASCTTLAATTVPFRFTGQRYDPETNLYYYKARYYCVGIGRFCETDPVGYGPDVNLYTAFGNDPTDKTDPTGALAASDCGTGSRIAGGGDAAGCSVAFEDKGRQRNSAGTNAPVRVAQVAPAEADAEGESGSSYREFENNDERDREGENREVYGHNPGADYPGDAESDVTITIDPKTFNIVIGRVKDLRDLEPGERSLLDRLPNQGSPRANWQQNSGVLREEMARGRPIRDASPGDTGGRFLNAERNLLRSHGWTFDPQTNYWKPPK